MPAIYNRRKNALFGEKLEFVEVNCAAIPSSGVVSLGDGGYGILTFDEPIDNGLGWDFAVFENSFSDDFLELAFVEVSSDGINFFRFPATSLTQDIVQVGGFGNIDANELDHPYYIERLLLT